jgi:hypothetical protein
VVLFPVHGLPNHQVYRDYPCSMWKVIFVSVLKWLQNKNGKKYTPTEVHMTGILFVCYICVCKECIMNWLLS